MMRSVTIIVRLSPRMNDQGTQRHVPVLEFQKQIQCCHNQKMILTLTIECVWGVYLKEECIRVIEIDEKASLYDLHDAIQDAVNFGRDHPFEFFLANSSSPYAAKKWLTEKEEWEDKEDDFCRIRLMDIWPMAGRNCTICSILETSGLLRFARERGKKNRGRELNIRD